MKEQQKKLGQPVETHQRQADFVDAQNFDVQRTGKGSYEEQVANAPALSELGLALLSPSERKDGGRMEYTTVPETVKTWAEDPYGDRKFPFLSTAYGIPPEELRTLFEETGMGEYLKAKDEGRFVGMVSTQVLKPTHYFMTNALVLGALARRGVPTSLMVFEYPDDKFFSGNADKKAAFDPIVFPVGVNHDPEKRDEHGRPRLETVVLELRPYGVREADGSVRRITNIDQANGYACDQVLVQAAEARGANNQSFTYFDELSAAEPAVNDGSGKKPKKTRKYTTQYEAALGLKIQGLVKERVVEGSEESTAEPVVEDAISLTDFYRALWMETVDSLRQRGDLPSEEEMPMFFADVRKFYTRLGHEAQPPHDVAAIMKQSTWQETMKDALLMDPEVVDTLSSQGNFEAAELLLAESDLKIGGNGLLKHLDDMLTPASYYAAQTALPDLYLECSSCGGDKFVGQVARGQEAQHALGLPTTEVRLPDQEVSALEAYTLHPTLQAMDVRVQTPAEIFAINQQVAEYQRQQKAGGLTKAQYGTLTQPLYARIKELQEQAKADYRATLENCDPRDFTEAPFVMPDAVAAVHKVLLDGVDTAVQSADVQAAVRRVTKDN